MPKVPKIMGALRFGIFIEACSFTQENKKTADAAFLSK
jgi:hypothetical protein